MSNSGPGAVAGTGTPGSGARIPGRGSGTVVSAVSGVPMSPRLDDPPGRLQPGAQEGVRGGAEADAGGVGRLQQRQAGFAVQGERLLGPHVLAGFTAAVATSTCAAGMVRLTMISTSGWFRAARHRADSGMPYSLARACAGSSNEVRDDVDLQVREDRQVVQVLLADVACTDDGDADGPCGTAGCQRRSCVHLLCCVRKARLSAMPSKMSPA